MKIFKAFCIMTICLCVFHMEKCYTCRFFKNSSTRAERWSEINLTFSIPSDCFWAAATYKPRLTVTRIAGKSSSENPVYCQLMRNNNDNCFLSSSVSCTCDARTREYTVRVKVNDSVREIYQVEAMFSDDKGEGEADFKENFTVFVNDGPLDEKAGVVNGTTEEAPVSPQADDEDKSIEIIVIAVAVVVIPLALFAGAFIFRWYKRTRANRRGAMPSRATLERFTGAQRQDIPRRPSGREEQPDYDPLENVYEPVLQRYSLAHGKPWTAGQGVPPMAHGEGSRDPCRRPDVDGVGGFPCSGECLDYDPVADPNYDPVDPTDTYGTERQEEGEDAQSWYYDNPVV
ncbi:uncharacterized protein LOC143282404 isoform X2 [Babylonia areolata]|uniref:uncharacterized protein LOC143282404 isoform X2 n=1 Tax=Babylonia areolata TaxID=304850 RepID=UPI003FD081CB